MSASRATGGRSGVTTIERALSAGTAILPGTERERYRREFAAELAELRGHHRWTYVLRVLVRLPWLRRTLRAPGTPSPLLLMVAALCFAGSAASGGWAAYQRWWPTCVAPDPRSEWADPSFGPLTGRGCILGGVRSRQLLGLPERSGQ